MGKAFLKDYKNILVETPYRGNPHLAFIRLNRPKVLNALSTELMEELVQALQGIDQDPDIRVSILTGDTRAFAAGADIAQMEKASPVDQIQEGRFRAWQQLSLLEKPLIAAVHGFALGGGCELAMSADILLAGEGAQFGQPEIKIGTIPGAGGTQRLTRAVGKARAMELILTGEMFDAKTAANWGLVSRVVPDLTLMEEAFQTAKTIAERAPVAVKLAEEAVNKAFETSLRDGMDFERRNFYLTFASADQKEGMRAFIEKRPAKYSGE